ncbi:neuroglobin-like [Mercenaria mercenaria]|uniref:neuroglobin-like n=1 Tax=Mercenaria mercenaria TaxID=6596 RepID=UPI001E1DD4CB|nr:neuroglobin-like [Mercenaria mercenaria]XP_045165807.1 neuroglobin-like [Mercenaria mercenaria]
MHERGLGNDEMADGILPEPAPPAPTDPRLPLNARQVFKLKKSWKGIKRNMASTGVEMFVRMFKANDDTKVLFDKFRNIDSEENLRISENLEKHGTKVLEVLDEVINNIDNVDDILELLKVTGAMHKRFTGFSPSMFWRIEEPFLKAVMLTLGDRYTDNMDVIYRLLIKFILEHLDEALKAELSSATTRNST